MENLSALLASKLPHLPLEIQERVKARLYEEYLLGCREDHDGKSLEHERIEIQRQISEMVLGERPKTLRAFRWFGGKNSKLDFLLPLLPEASTYVEPFAGSAAVLLNRAPSPNEVYNDLDPAVVNFFSVLRDAPSRDALIEQLTLTPYSRGEFVGAIAHRPPSRNEIPDVESARRFFVLAIQGHNGLAQTANPTHWSRVSSGVNKNLRTQLARVPELIWVADRLLGVTIENRPAIEVIARYDSPTALFYCDPPYVHSVRSRLGAYFREMNDDDHRVLAQALNAIRGKAAVSGYDSPLYEELYKGWNRHDDRPRRKPSGTALAREVLWTNY